ncbi:hypothetical protein [Geobacter sp. DSM 9736]|uniref:hypothetical protein n=1 Tax=Geobacter sp. DSM 9736 TaxID=1277350 RepID=UPI000B4FE587|nr:hypothetical protein [Geobacter sp. DSM 9736]SNB44913.1 hypothetical protein SAMN06269301_0303 [Geobacter sp. DSM 9736]
MSIAEGRIAPSGLFRLTGYDQYDYCDYRVGDYPSLEIAIREARSRALTPNAVPSSFSDIFFVYDHLGVCRYRVTHDELMETGASGAP